MKASHFFVSTLKEAPSDAEVASHQLMLRAGMIKRLSAGIYSYMPMGLRVIHMGTPAGRSVWSSSTCSRC